MGIIHAVMKIRFFLFFVILYILLAFGWWLYSLLNYIDKEKINETQIIHLQAKQFEIEMEHSRFYPKFPDALLDPTKRKSLDSLFVVLNKPLNRFSLKWNKDGTAAFSIVPVPESLNKIAIQSERRQRAFISEAIFFAIAVVIGVVWLFLKIEHILNLNRMQNNILLSVTHELKTPLAGIKLVAQTLIKRDIDPELQKELLLKANIQTDRLDSLINNVLLTSRIDSKTHQYTFQPIMLGELADECIQTILPYSDKKISFENRIDENARIHGDRLSVLLVISNLIQNSIKYSDDNCRIELKTNLKKKGIQLIVSDNGIGIPREERRKVFDKFYRVGNEDTRSAKGTGLGLYIVRQILKIHSATIRIDENVAKGTTFVIDFKSK
jgi:signal transduction histidine kinase